MPGEDALLRRRLCCRGWISGLLVGCWMLGGCALPTQHIGCSTPDYRPTNVFLYAPGLSPDLKRIAVLPLASEDQRPDLEEVCETLSPVVQAELVKTGKFEIVGVSHEILQSRTGRWAWTGTELLPKDFFDSMRELCGCDAVLFCQLTEFRAYEPLAVGWRMKLVNARTGQTLWAVDELLDAAQQPVLNGARHHPWAGLWSPHEDGGDWPMRNSPRLFAQYAAAQVFRTLPNR